MIDLIIVIGVIAGLAWLYLTKPGRKELAVLKADLAAARTEIANLKVTPVRPASRR